MICSSLNPGTGRHTHHPRISHVFTGIQNINWQRQFSQLAGLGWRISNLLQTPASITTPPWSQQIIICHTSPLILCFKSLEMVIDWTWGAGLATSFAGGGPEEPACQCRRDQRLSSIPALGISPRGGNGTPPVFRSGESHGQRSLAGYSPWGRQELDTSERLTLHFTSCVSKA